MATSTWIGGSGDWSSATDWSNGQVPTSAMEAVIDTTVTVTISGPSAAHRLTLDSKGAYVVLSSTLDLSGRGGPGDLVIDAGRFSTDAGSTLDTGGGSIALGGAGASLVSAGLIALHGGTLSVGSGTLHLEAHGTAAGAISLAAGGRIIADSGAQLGLSLSTIAASETGTGGTISIARGASLTVTTDNTGLLTTAQLQNELFSGGFFTNKGALSVVVASTIDNAGATLTIAAATPYTIAAGGDLAGGTVAVTTGSLTDNGLIDFSGGGTLSLAGGVLTGDGTVEGGTLLLAGGSFDPAGLTLSGVAVQGAIGLLAGQTLDLAGGTTVAAERGASGTITVGSGATLTTDGQTLLGGNTVILNGGTWNAAEIGAATVDLSGGKLLAQAIDAGAVIDQVGSGAAIGAEGSALLTAGRIDAGVAGGTLKLAGDITNSGTIAITDGDTVTVSAGQLTSSGGGIVLVTAGTLHVLNTGSFQGAVRLGAGGTVLASSGAQLGLALSTLAASEAGTGTITVADGAALAVTTDNTGVLTTATLLTGLANGGGFTDNGQLSVVVATVLTNTGSTLNIRQTVPYVVATGGSIVGGTVAVTDGTLTDNGLIDFSAGGTLSLTGGLFQGGGTVEGGALLLAGGGLFAAGMTLAGVAVQGDVALGSSETLSLTDGTTVSAPGGGGGTLDVAGGAELVTDAQTTLAGETVTLDGGLWNAISITAASVAVSAGGFLQSQTLSGSGMVALSSGTVTADEVTNAVQLVVSGGQLSANTIDASGSLDLSGSGAAHVGIVEGTEFVGLSGGSLAAQTIGSQVVIDHQAGSSTLSGLNGHLDTAGQIVAAAAGATLDLVGTVTDTGSIGISNSDEVVVLGAILDNASGGTITVTGAQFLVPASGPNGASSLINGASAIIDINGGGTFFDFYGSNAGIINLAAGSTSTLGSGVFAGTSAAGGSGVVNADPNANVTVLTTNNETLQSFTADQTAVRADLGRPNLDLQLGNVLNLAASDNLSVGAGGLTSRLVVNGSYYATSLQPAIAIYGGDTFVGTGGALTLDDGNMYSQGSDVATLVISGGGTLVAAGAEDAINGNVFNDAGMNGSSATGNVFVDPGTSLTIAGNFVNGSAPGGGAIPTVTLADGASLTIYDNSDDAGGSNGVFFLYGSSSLVLQNQADLRNQSVQFIAGGNETVNLQNTDVATSSYPLETALFGFAASDRIILPFEIGSLGYDGTSGDLTVTDASGHTAGADFYVGQGYSSVLFAGVGSAVLTYGGPAPGAVMGHLAT